MIVIGVDPGGTTGYCVCMVHEGEGSYDLRVVDSGQRETSFALPDLYSQLISRYRPKGILVESVVKTGQLTQGKLDQLAAFDRLAVIAYARKIPLREVTPQARGKVTEVPDEVKGRHARDAYRVIEAYYRGVANHEATVRAKEAEGWDSK